MQRSYAADYMGFVVLLVGYMFVCLPCKRPQLRVLVLTRNIQILTIAEPFHRMFSLDNIAIQFPHAEIERVPVSTSPPTLFPTSLAEPSTFAPFYPPGTEAHLREPCSPFRQNTISSTQGSFP